MPGADIRPTSDRLRESLFDVLTAGDPSKLEGSVWIDLFAGTGAVGIEALSRGAGMVYFVESAKPAAELIQNNLAPLGVTGKFRILLQPVRRAVTAVSAEGLRPDFIFLDPPYALKNAYQQTLAVLANSALSRKALVIAEHERKFDPGEKFGLLQRVRLLVQGDAALSFYRRNLSDGRPIPKNEML